MGVQYAMKLAKLHGGTAKNTTVRHRGRGAADISRKNHFFTESLGENFAPAVAFAAVLLYNTGW